MTDKQPTEQTREPAADPTVSITIDGRTVEARPGEMVISAAERAGVFIPRFCYHPHMKPVGVCRMCLVEIKGPRGFSLQPSCYVPVAEGQEVVTTSDKVRKAQDGVLEFLLVNHPLDCPVCDKGGECPLQDQTVAYGPGESRFVEEKRHWAKPMAISELVLLDRERCIQCSRCTRFAAEVAGDPEIDFLGRGGHIEVGTFPERDFISYFSGNTVQICPVGALTAAPYRFKARPWDLDQVESTCVTCSVGCRVAVQSSANRLTRYLGIDVGAVNQGWLCDKGRFAFEAVHSEERIASPMVRKDGELVEASWPDALAAAASGIEAARTAGGPGAVGVLGGARLTNEGAFAWVKLAKSVIGTDSVDAQLGDGLAADVVLGLPRATIDQACRSRATVLVCGDLREELPVLFLRLRVAAAEHQLPIVEVAPRATSMTQHTAQSHRYVPGELAAAIERLVGDPAGCGIPGGTGDGEGIVVVVGRPSVAEDGALAASAALRLAAAWPRARFLPALRRGNVLGALDMGFSPGLLPGRVTVDAARDWFTAAWGSLPAGRGMGAGALLAAAAEGGAGAPGALLLVGADPASDFPDSVMAQHALDQTPFVIEVGAHRSASTAFADVFLPVATHDERRGTTTNIEGRISRLGQKLTAPGLAWSDWMVASELAEALGGDLGIESFASIWDEIERVAPAYAGITASVLDSPAARDGLVVPLAATAVAVGPARSQAMVHADPIAIPGIESVERQGAAPRAGAAIARGGAAEARYSGGAVATGPGTVTSDLAVAAGALAAEDIATEVASGRDMAAQLASASDPGTGAPGPATANGSANGTSGDHPAVGAGRPPLVQLAALSSLDVPHVPHRDGYSLRLVASRRLFDGGVAVQNTPALAALAKDPVLRVSPYDLDRLGVKGGDKVRVRSARSSVVVAVAPDAESPRGVVTFDLNPKRAAPGGEPTGGTGSESVQGAEALIDATAPVTDVRLETL